MVKRSFRTTVEHHAPERVLPRVGSTMGMALPKEGSYNPSADGRDSPHFPEHIKIRLLPSSLGLCYYQCFPLMGEGRILVWVARFFFLLLLNVATNNQIKGRRIQRKWVVNTEKRSGL